jgi:hypothetical protein
MRSRFFCLVVLLGFSTLGTSLFGQAISGDVTGVISDKTGGVIATATVTAQNEATGVKSTTSTNPEGVYRFGNLPIGSYTITASANGFTTATVKGLRVVLSNVITANLTLEVGSAATTLEVSAAAAAIDTTTAQVQTTYESRQTVELPTAANSNGAGIWNLSLIGAGVASQGGVGQGTGPSIAGQRPEDNTFMLDGVSNVNHYSTGPLLYTSNEAVAEVSLLQNQFSPEFGGGSGGVFNAVVKGGSNSIHGSAYEYLQNRNLNAVDALQWTQGLTSLPRYDNNRLGATIGGPIRKNKLFYFGNFEYNPIGQSAVPGSPLEAPTSAGMSALAAIPGISTTNLGWFQKWVPVAPSANAGSITVQNPLIAGSPTYTIPIGYLSFASPTYGNNYDAVVSIDYNITDRDQMRGRWIYNKYNGLDTAANLPAFFQSAPNDNYLYSISEFHTFTPTFQNEFRGSFSRNFNSIQVGSQTFPGMSVIPNIQIDDLNTLQIGPDPNTPSGSIQNLFQLQDNATKIAGKHTLKFGYHFTDVILTNYFIQRVRGDYDYLSLQQYLFDLTPDDLGERSAGPTSYPCGFLENEAFFNDDFRVRPNLTVNLGLRYEYTTIPVASRYQKYSAPANVPGLITFGEPKPSPNDWSPRIGFAWSPGGNSGWSIRGGVSRAFDPTYANLTSNAAPPYFQQTNDVDLSSNAPNFLKGGGLPGTAVPLPTDPRAALGLVGSYTFGGKLPYGVTWNLGTQRVFHHDYTLEVRYVGTKGVHLWNQSRLNVEALVNPSNYIPTYFTMPSASTFASLTRTLGQVKSYIVPGGTASQPYNFLASLGSEANIVGYAPQGYSSYNGMAAQLTRRYSNHFQYVLAYTWSHNEDDATATNFSTYLTPRRSQDFQNLRADWSASALDHRQRLTFTPIYDWKAFENKSWLMKNLVSNWTFAGTFTYETPEYATVQSGLDTNLNNDSAGDRSIVNPAGAASVGTGVTGYNAQGQAVAAGNASIVAYVANNSNARYVVAAQGALANGGKNTFPLHPTNNIDMSVKKRFAFGETRSFTIGAQFYNILNHAQFTGSHVSDVLSYGYIGSRNDLLPSNSAFGRFDEFYTSNSRVGQLSAKFEF